MPRNSKGQIYGRGMYGRRAATTQSLPRRTVGDTVPPEAIKSFLNGLPSKEELIGFAVAGPWGVMYADSKNKEQEQAAARQKKYAVEPAAPTPTAPVLSSSQAYGGPNANELAKYSDLQVRSQFRPTINDLTRQMDAANAMGMQAQNAIGGWGQEAGQEIRGAGRRNYREVKGIQGNVGNMLGAVASAGGNIRTGGANAAMMRGAAGTAGLIAGLGAADQGWFNRARDVNAQTTNFYRNNARDQYAQQAADLLAQRNEQVRAMREARTAGRIQAQQQAFENRLAASNGGGSDGTLGLAMQKFQESLGLAGGVKQIRDTFANQISSPEERRYFNQWVRQNYYGTADTAQGKARLRLVNQNRERAKQTK